MAFLDELHPQDTSAVFSRWHLPFVVAPVVKQSRAQRWRTNLWPIAIFSQGHHRMIGVFGESDRDGGGIPLSVGIAEPLTNNVNQFRGVVYGRFKRLV
jgi:hypothetical protein